jgi:hypothetical protein
MIFLFGDSWARHSTTQVENKHNTLDTSATLSAGPLKNIQRFGYKHWDLPDIFVEFNTNDWFNSYFQKNSVINFGEFGNTNSWILENLHNRMAGVSNLKEPIAVIVYQTDPMRIFAPRKDYTNQDIVWPAFKEWCHNNNFDYATQTLEELINAIFNNFYLRLSGFKVHAKTKYGLDIDLKLVGGVNAVHPSHSTYGLDVLIQSVSEFFGYTKDTVIENHLALHRLIGFWCDHVSATHKYRLLEEWCYYDVEVSRKTKFWNNTPEYFAGRHLTSTAMAHLAEYIESKIGQANL